MFVKPNIPVKGITTHDIIPGRRVSRGEYQQNPYLSYDRVHTLLIYLHLAMTTPH